MALVKLVCPHCSGRFELENPPAGANVACPLCGQMMAIPARLRRRERLEGAQRDDEAAPTAFDVGELAPAELLPHGETGDAVPVVRPLTREQRDHRRQIRNLIWMIGGGILLAIAAIVLSRM